MAREQKRGTLGKVSMYEVPGLWSQKAVHTTGLLFIMEKTARCIGIYTYQSYTCDHECFSQQLTTLRTVLFEICFLKVQLSGYIVIRSYQFSNNVTMQTNLKVSQ